MDGQKVGGGRRRRRGGGVEIRVRYYIDLFLSWFSSRCQHLHRSGREMKGVSGTRNKILFLPSKRIRFFSFYAGVVLLGRLRGL